MTEQELNEAVELARRRLADTPAPKPPPELVDRWCAALAELPPPRPSPLRQLTRPKHWAVAALGAAAAAAILLVPPVSDPPTKQGTSSGTTPSMALNSADARRIGDLADPMRLAGCLKQVGVPGAQVLDGRRTEWRGQSAVRLTIGTAPGHYRMLVVSADCAAGSGRLLADRAW